jgi:hypothetical protein
VQVIRFDVLPDDVLLDIFDFYMDIPYYDKYDNFLVEEWQTLVHVCRRWRGLVFRSPRRLNLRLYCTPQTRIRDPDTLDIWPALPLVVQGFMPSLSEMDNITGALERSNRVCQVHLWALSGWQLKQVLAAMQVPFPELTVLELSSDDVMPPVIPDSFLGGSAPRLRHFELHYIPFTGLPNLLLSATRLVKLRLSNIPDSGYISPEAIIAPLSALSSLETLYLKFSPRSRSDWETRRLHSPKRSILPFLESFEFEGSTEYLEDLVTLIDTPQLDYLEIRFPNQIDSDIQRLAQFISRTPKRRKHDRVQVDFNDSRAYVWFGILQIYIMCSERDRQLSSVVQFFSSSIFSTVKDLYIEGRPSKLDSIWQNDAIENALWLQLLLPFTAAKNLYLHKEFAPRIARALQELVGDRIISTLPSLLNIFVEELEPFGKSIGQFIVARQLSGHPFTISAWDKTSQPGRPAL